MLQRSRSISGQEEEHGRTSYWYQVERQEDDEFSDLSEGEGGIDSRYCGFTQLLHRIFAIGVEDARGGYQVCVTLIDEDCVEDINKSFVNEEGFEEKGDDGSAFSKDEESGIKPCEMAVEDR